MIINALLNAHSNLAHFKYLYTALSNKKKDTVFIGLDRIFDLAGFPVIINIRPDTKYWNYPVKKSFIQKIPSNKQT